MKRFTGALLCALVLAVSMVSTASAGRWVSVPVQWERSTTAGGPYALFDYTTPANAKVDTTDGFSIDKADPPPVEVKVSVAAQDTAIYAKLIVYGESTTASTVVFDATAFVLQANSGSEVTGWQPVYTYSSLNTSGQKYVEVPIWSARAATITRDLYIDRTSNLSLFGNQLRLIATWAGATVAAPRCKVKLVYWDADAQ